MLEIAAHKVPRNQEWRKHWENRAETWKTMICNSPKEQVHLYTQYWRLNVHYTPPFPTKSVAELWSKPLTLKKDKHCAHCKALTLLGVPRSLTPGAQEKKGGKITDLPAPFSTLHLSWCYVTRNLCARTSHVIELIKSYYCVLRRLWGKGAAWSQEHAN